MATQNYLKSGLVEQFATKERTDRGRFRFGFHLEKWFEAAFASSPLALLKAPLASPTFTGKVIAPAGAVANPGLVVGANDNGMYEVGAGQIGASIGDALVGGWQASGLFTKGISEQVAGSGIQISHVTIMQHTASAVNATATATAAQLGTGLITSTSAAAVTLTLPLATAIATQISGVRGTTFDFIVDNSVGANIVTVAVNTGITLPTAVITGGSTLTVAAATVGHFRLYFISATAAHLYRLA